MEAQYPTGGRDHLELFMAVWTPGSYLIREYERHVERVTATSPDGGRRSVEKTRKNRWKIDARGAASITVSYRVYGREMTVRNNWIESAFAMLNGAPTFMTLVDGKSTRHEVRVERPAAWKGIATPLAPVSGAHDTFLAADFDMLVDSPIVIGNPAIREFQVAGKPHYVVLEGDTSLFNIDRAIADVQRIVEAGGMVMRCYEYPYYYFLNVITEAGGGLEHTNSFLGMTTRFAMRSRRAYIGWLGLLAHEYFHTWNGKRLRPAEFGPFDYENEVYTKSLWVVEGITDYYASVLMRRAAITTTDEFLDELSNMIEQVQTAPGRLVASVATASFDAWIKAYRPDENTPNTSVNYYAKGGVISLLLDAKIRAATDGVKSLDDAMRVAYARYTGEKRYTLEEFHHTMSEVAGVDLTPWFATAVESTDELDYSELLAWFGLRFRPVDTRHARAWLGATTRADAGGLVVTQVRRDTPAFTFGVNVDDEIIAIDDVRVRADGFAARLEQYRPGDEVAVLVARRDRLLRLDVTLGTEPGRTWRLEVLPQATAAQKQHREGWWGR